MTAIHFADGRTLAVKEDAGLLAVWLEDPVWDFVALTDDTEQATTVYVNRAMIEWFR